MEPDADKHSHEETIVPVKPGLSSKPAEAAPAERRRLPANLVAGLTVAGLVLVAVAVFSLLPRWVEQRAEAPAASVGANAVAAPESPDPPPLSEEQIAALQASADQLLAELLTQQQRLELASAESWAEGDWQRYESLSRAGDDAYLAHDYEVAIDSYTDALELGEALLARSDQITANALEAGQRALEAGDAALAMKQFELVLGIEAENAAALAGRERAERLPQAIAATRRGDGLRQAGELDEAADAYRAALEIDPAWAPAQRALEQVEQSIAEGEFDRLMSAGFAALGDERYADADEQFRRALAMRPGSAEARDGLLQAQQGARLDQIALAEARGLAFERRELWSEAIAQYAAALDGDAGLAFAQQGIERARRRADLDAKLANLIENPTLLFTAEVLPEARGLLDDAQAIAASDDVGTARLEQQIAELSRLVELAATPVAVDLRSDGLTEVTLYRVGRLGTFDAMEVELRPGNYTALGSRNGYRDVRKTFTVLPGRDLQPISVICVEPI